jgi:hypothetical protein
VAEQQSKAQLVEADLLHFSCKWSTITIVIVTIREKISFSHAKAGLTFHAFVQLHGSTTMLKKGYTIYASLCTTCER